MTQFKMAYAKTHLASLIREAMAGDEVIIARDDQPLVRLVPLAIDTTAHERAAGDLVGKLTLPDEFFRALSADDVEEWEQ
jgi:antitoxin (DNA-binding transcriptional repressor) of toxin-antitoxin stability system